jgi:hypothetical protein
MPPGGHERTQPVFFSGHFVFQIITVNQAIENEPIALPSRQSITVDVQGALTDCVINFLKLTFA